MQRCSDAGSALSARWRAIGAARACSTVRSALRGRFATDVAANYAAPGRTKSNAKRAALRSGNVGNQVVVSGRLACTGQASGPGSSTSRRNERGARRDRDCACTAAPATPHPASLGISASKFGKAKPSIHGALRLGCEPALSATKSSNPLTQKRAASRRTPRERKPTVGLCLFAPARDPKSG